MKFKKINAPSATELFAEQIETAIFSGELKSGEKLPSERELQDQLGVSRNVVNSALQRLARKHLIVMKPRQGNYVADYRKDGNLETLNAILTYGHYDRHLLQSIMEMRMQIEPAIVRAAAKFASDDQIQEAKQLLANFENEQNAIKQGKITTEFFHQLAIASANDVYPMLVNSFSTLYQTLTVGLCQAGKKKQIGELNEQLLAAIENRDAKAADQTDRHLIDWSRQILIEGKWNQ